MVSDKESGITSSQSIQTAFFVSDDDEKRQVNEQDTSLL